jgi:hypothetical protein
MMSKALVINGSPTMEKGDTALVVHPFIQGMADAGAEVELFYASRLKVKPCSCGRMVCWNETPGQCCIKDGMQLIYPKLEQADILVLAAPVYIPLPGAMQDVINRLCPLLDPLQIEFREGRTRARFRHDVAIRKIVLVCISGWWELGNCGTVVRIAEELAADAGVEFAGALLRPHAWMMRQQGKLTPDGEAVLAAVRSAGRELISEGAIAPATLQAAGRPLISQEELWRRYTGA